MSSPIAVTYKFSSMKLESLGCMVMHYHYTSLPSYHSKAHSLIKCAIFAYLVSGIDVCEDALRGMKFGRCSVGESYPLASTYEYTKREFIGSICYYASCNSILIFNFFFCRSLYADVLIWTTSTASHVIWRLCNVCTIYYLWCISFHPFSILWNHSLAYWRNTGGPFLCWSLNGPFSSYAMFTRIFCSLTIEENLTKTNLFSDVTKWLAYIIVLMFLAEG